MIFIPTCSDDGTTDLLLPHLQKEAEVFRFDIDKFRDYRWDVSTFGVSMSDAFRAPSLPAAQASPGAGALLDGKCMV